jgi:hypothetical protein
VPETWRRDAARGDVVGSRSVRVMTGSELRRFVGGPFPNLVPGPSGAGTVRGPFPNLVPAALRQVAPDAPVIAAPATTAPAAAPLVDPLVDPAGRRAPASA